MNYIINPSVFYWMHTIDTIRTILALVMALSGVGSFVLIGAWIGDWCYDEDGTKLCRKWCIRTAVIAAVCLIAVVFVPNKQTMYAMLIAKMATVENVNITVDGIKSIVDYIVEAAKAIK